MFRPFLQVTGSKLLSSGLAFAFGVAVARLLGPEQYGLLSMSFAVTAVTTELTGNALEIALVRFATHFLHNGQRGRAAATCRVVFRFKLLVNGALLAAALVLAEPLARALGNPAYELPIQAGVAGALGLSLWRLTLSILQTLQVFGTYAVVQSANGVIKLGGLALVLFFGGLNLPLALMVHVVSFFAGFLLGGLLCPHDLIRLGGESEPDIWRSIFHFSKWILPASFFSILNAWLGVLILGYFTAPRLVGEFAAAFTLIRSFDILKVSFNTVLLPAACRISDRVGGLGFVRRSLMVSGLLSVALLPLYLATTPLFWLLYSSAFERAPDIFRILFWGFLISLNADPIVLVLYAKNLPKVVAALELSKLLVTLVAYLILVPVFSTTGAALAASLGRLAGGVIGAGAVYLVLRTPSGASTETPWPSPTAETDKVAL